MIQTGAHIAGWLGRHEYAVMTLLSLCVLLGLLTGCSTTRTVTVPAAESTVRTAPPDSSQETMLPPPEPVGQITHPETVVLYADTPRFTVELSMLEVDRTDPDDQTVTVRARAGDQIVEQTLALPVVGEALRGTVDSTGLQWTVPGAPTSWTVEGYVQDAPPWYEQVGRWLRLFMAFVGGGAFVYVAVKLIPGL